MGAVSAQQEGLSVLGHHRPGLSSGDTKKSSPSESKRDAGGKAKPSYSSHWERSLPEWEEKIEHQKLPDSPSSPSYIDAERT